MASARQRYADDQRIAALTIRLTDLQRAEQVRAYAEALRRVADDEPDSEEAADVLAWSEWIGGYADRLDPRGWP